MARGRNNKLLQAAETPGQRSLQGWLRQSTQAGDKRGHEDVADLPAAKVARLSESPRREKKQVAKEETNEARNTTSLADNGPASPRCNTSTDDGIANVKNSRHETTPRKHQSPCRDDISLHEDAKSPSSPRIQVGQSNLTLRERLAQRAACGSPELTAGLQDNFPSPLLRQQNEQQEEQEQHQHRMLGGLSLKWRLTLLGGAKSATKTRAASHQKDQASNEAPEVKETPPEDTGESVRPSVASPWPIDVMSEDVSTPPPSERSSATLSHGMSTPAPPSKNARGHVTSGNEAFEGDTPPKKRNMQDEANAPKSVKELKKLLENQGITCDTCTCREDLEALWRLHMELNGGQAGQEPRGHLRSNVVGGKEPTSVERKRALSTGATKKKKKSVEHKPDAASPKSSPCLEKQGSMASEPATSPGKEAGDLSTRKQVAEEEITRLLGIHQDSFASRARWAFSVLRLPLSGAGTTIAAVQHAYRALMRTVHPDRVGPVLGLSQAIEVLRRARVEGERALDREVVPGPPRSLRARMLSADDAGLHRVKLEWGAPTMQREAPVRSYVIAAVDPAYGRALTVAKLEPDYSEELNRFVSIEELVSFVLAEKEMPKMSGLFHQTIATLQVAAANKAGQSPWSVVKVALK